MIENTAAAAAQFRVDCMRSNLELELTGVEMRARREGGQGGDVGGYYDRPRFLKAGVFGKPLRLNSGRSHALLVLCHAPDRRACCMNDFAAR